MPRDVAWLQNKLEDAKALMQEFKVARITYEDVLHRRLKPVTDPRLGNVATGADYRTPDLAEELHNLMDLVAKNPPRVDAVPGKEGSDAEKQAQNAMKWCAAMMAIMDDGGWVRRRRAAGQGIHGVKIMRMLYRDYDEDTEGSNVFYYSDVDTLANYWLVKDEQIEAIFWEYELPVISAGEELGTLGAQLAGKGYDSKQRYVPIASRLQKSGVAWVGDDTRIGGSAGREKLMVTVCEYRDHQRECPICDDKHPLWSGLEMVRGMGVQFQDGEVVSEYTLPYRYEPTLRLTVGREGYEHDPHFRYFAFLYPLIVEAATINWANTVLFALANKDSSYDNVYAAISKMPPEAISQIPQNIWETMSLPIPDTETNRIPMLPPLEVWPSNNLDQTFLEMKRDAENRFQSKKINAHLLGTAFNEAEHGTGSAYLSATQQAAVPLDWLLEQLGKSQLHDMYDMLHAIQYWQEMAPPGVPEMRYGVTLAGGEKIAGSANKGERLYMSASMLDTHPILLLDTKSDTLQEQSERQRQALERWQSGVDDDEQLLKELGHYDVEEQMRRITKQRQLRRTRPIVEGLQDNVLRLILPTVLNIDPSLMPPGPVPLQPAGQPAPGASGAPPGGQALPPAPQPTIRLPADVGRLGRVPTPGTFP